MSTRRGPFTFDAFDPPSGTCEVSIQEKRLLAMARLGKWHLLNARDLVPIVLAMPTLIFQGLRWENDEDRDRPGWRCYCGKPMLAYDENGHLTTVDPGQTFLVFVNDRFVAYNWRWELADPADSEMPRESGTRFEAKIFDAREARP